MTLNKLFETLSFHDGEIENVFIYEKDIIIHFWLSAFLQNSHTKEQFAISDKSQNNCLSTQIRFSNYLNLKHNFDIENNKLLLEDCELWDITNNENINEITFHLKNYSTHTFSTISFHCDTVDILSCITNIT